MAAPLFTVVTITYNSGAWVKAAIESVLASGFKNFEYLICDDCSADTTWDIIQSYTDERIKSYRHNINLGEYQNRNFALEHATGQYIIFVDGDDELYPGTLEGLASYTTGFPEAGTVWGVTKDEFYFNQLPLLLQPEEMMKWIYLANIRIAQIGFADTIFKTRLLRSLGGFSVKYISGDTHIKKRCALEAPVLLVPGGMIHWRVSEGQASSRLSVNYNGFRNNVSTDKEILLSIKNKQLKIPVEQVETNIRTRNIKLLFKHTFRKGKIADGIRLFKELDFDTGDFKYLFKKGDYSYYQFLLHKMRNH